ncbi:hypothetical protein E1B22_12520 (plasmid) [Thermaerobacter sp. FW80]|uniref:UPF0236 family transposase-like protein n=1 Tax=Thermaerobacter sp. FW80 TaxID=2546351 RepID=UPI0010757981|nr:UPF0236 family protein [Thermaerobacter sp. FW80]QBS38730.1 hypothetical protein E1B22_12520 [Thermaerobacter sp. FW80]
MRLSAMALWADVQAAGARADEAAKAQREAVFERGEIPPGSRPAAAVDLEFDELLVRGRRRGPDGQKERIALMHALAYEGKATDARGRTVLKNRRVHVAVGEGTASIEEALAAFAAEWDWARVEQCTVGGDGAPWIRKALEYLPQASYRLDPFHLKRPCGGDCSTTRKPTGSWRRPWPRGSRGARWRRSWMRLAGGRGVKRATASKN